MVNSSSSATVQQLYQNEKENNLDHNIAFIIEVKYPSIRPYKIYFYIRVSGPFLGHKIGVSVLVGVGMGSVCLWMYPHPQAQAH